MRGQISPFTIAPTAAWRGNALRCGRDYPAKQGGLSAAIALLTLLLWPASAARATVFVLDFNGGSGTLLTQPGYEVMTWNVSNNNSFSLTSSFPDALGGNVTVNFSGNRARNRSALTGDHAARSNLLRDWFGSSGAVSTLNLTLPAGTFELTTWHHDVDASAITGNVAVTDADGTTNLTFSQTGGSSPASIGEFMRHITSFGSGPVQLAYSHASSQLAVNGLRLELTNAWTATQDGLWSNAGNWLGGQVADGAENVASFWAADIQGDVTVGLDSSRTLRGLSFGDADTDTPGGWIVNNNGNPANVLSLGGASSVVSVGNMAAGSKAELALPLQVAGTLEKTGPGILVLSGDNAYAGLTIVSAGTLQIGSGGTSGSVTGGITNNAVLAFDRSDTFTVSNVISGTGSLEQLGTGRLVLIGDNTYTGPTVVRQGTLELGLTGTLRSTGVGQSESRAYVVGQNSGSATMIINGGTISSPSAGHFNVGDSGTAEGTVIQNSGNVTLVGALRMAVFSSGTKGRYEIHGGKLDLNHTGSGYLQIARDGQATFIQTGGEVYARRTSGDALIMGVFGSAHGRYEMSGGTLTIDGPAILGHSDSAKGTFIQTGGTVTLNHEARLGNSANNVGRWEISGGNLNLSMNTSRFFYVGSSGEGTVVQTGGTVRQPAGGAMYLANSSTGKGYYQISGGTLDQGSLSIGHSGGLGEFTQTGGEVIARRDVRLGRGSGGTGMYSISNGTLTITNSGGDDGRLIVGRDGANASGTVNQTGGIVDAQGGVRLANGSGISGAYNLSGGELRVPAIDKGNGTATFNWSGGTIRPRTGGNLAVTMPLTLSGTGATFNSSDADGTARTITVNTTLGGSGALTKTGAGTLLLQHANGYTGPTTVSGGTLKLGPSGAVAASSSILVGAGATFDVADVSGGFAVAGGQTLAGNGTVLGDTTLAADGILAPGMSIGTLRLKGDLKFSAGAFFDIDIAEADGVGIADLVDMSDGANTLYLDESATIRVRLLDGFRPEVGTSYTILTGESSRSGEFGSDVAVWDGFAYQPTFDGWKWFEVGYGNSVVLNVVPEPGTWLLLLCTLACGLLVRRRH